MNKILLLLAVMLVLTGRAWGDLASDAKDKYAQHDYEGAIADYTLIIQSKPDDAEAYNQRGLAKNAQWDPKGAIADFSKAIELNPNDAEAYDRRSHAKMLQGDVDGAIGDCNKAINLKPSYTAAYADRSLLKQRKGDLDGAMVDAAKAVELEPDSNLAYLVRGEAKYGKHDFDGAIADDTKAISLEPDNEGGYIFRSSAESAKGDTNGANADHKKANLLISKMVELDSVSRKGQLSTTAIIQVAKDGPQTVPDEHAVVSELGVFISYDALMHVDEKLGLSKLWGISDNKVAAKITNEIIVKTGDKPGLYTVACYGLEHDLAVKIVNELCVFATERPYGESINGGPSQAVHVTIVKRAE